MEGPHHLGQGTAIGWLGHGGLQWLSTVAGMRLGESDSHRARRGDLRQITYSVVEHLDCQTDCYIPNLTTISRSPPNCGESRLQQHGTISPSLRTTSSLTRSLTRYQTYSQIPPGLHELPHRTCPSGDLGISYLRRRSHVPSSDGAAGELRRTTRSTLHWRLWHDRSVRVLGSWPFRSGP